jgi:hypothetical protein
MTLPKAIIIASATFALALVVAVGLLVGIEPSASTKAASETRYQIAKIEQGRVWRLDKSSGEISICTMRGDAMVCGKSGDAIVRPKTSYEDFSREKRQARADRRQENFDFIDRIFLRFERLIGFIIEQENRSKGCPEGPESTVS